MTRAQLKSKCLLMTRDLSPEAYTPSVDDVIAQCSRGFARAIGGIPKTAESFNTVVDQQEYGTDDGFPSDFHAIEFVTKTLEGGTILNLGFIDKSERRDTAAEPTAFYINKKSKIIGFDYIPDTIIPITMHYIGLGTTPTADDSVILSELNLGDSDDGWDAIAHRYAEVYYKARHAEAVLKENLKMAAAFEREVEWHGRKKREIEHDISIGIDRHNQSTSRRNQMPIGYFSPGGELNHGRII